MTYRVYSYDVWGNETDGYEVNDVYRTRHEIEINDLKEFESDDFVIKALQDLKYLNPALPADHFEVDGDEYTIYVNRAKDSMPLCELRRE